MVQVSVDEALSAKRCRQSECFPCPIRVVVDKVKSSCDFKLISGRRRLVGVSATFIKRAGTNYLILLRICRYRNEGREKGLVASKVT